MAPQEESYNCICRHVCSSTTSHALYIDPLTVVVDQGQNIEGGDKRELAGSIICSLAIVGHVGKGLL